MKGASLTLKMVGSGVRSMLEVKVAGPDIVNNCIEATKPMLEVLEVSTTVVVTCFRVPPKLTSIEEVWVVSPQDAPTKRETLQTAGAVCESMPTEVLA